MKRCPWILSIRGVGEKASAESPKTSFDLQGKLTGGGHGSDPGAWPSQASQPASQARRRRDKRVMTYKASFPAENTAPIRGLGQASQPSAAAS